LDDARIKQLADDVLAQLGAEHAGAPDLEARVAALERALSRIATSSQAPAVAAALVVTASRAESHPSLRLLDVAGGSDHCVLEPDRPCIQSGRCRHLGH